MVKVGHRRRTSTVLIGLVAAVLVTGCGASNKVSSLEPSAALTSNTPPPPSVTPSDEATPSPTSAAQSQAESVCDKFDAAAVPDGSVSEKDLEQVLMSASALDSPGPYRYLTNDLFVAQQQGLLASIKAGGGDIIVPKEQVGAFGNALGKVRTDCHVIRFGHDQSGRL